jgi:hypothetical protein
MNSLYVSTDELGEHVCELTELISCYMQAQAQKHWIFTEFIRSIFFEEMHEYRWKQKK